MMAMEIGALDELSNGRVSLSIGTGIISALQKIELAPEKPLAALRDTVAIARDLLGRKEVDYTGAVFSAHKVRLDYSPRSDIPIFVAGRGNLMVKLAGEIADGLLVSNMCSAAFAGHLAATLRASRKAAGRGGGDQVIQYMPCALNVDQKAAITAAKRAIGGMLPGFWDLGQKLKSARDGLLAGTDIAESEFAAASARVSAGEDPADVLDERYTRAFALAGAPENCLAAAERCAAGGVSELALTFAGPTALADIKTLGAAASAHHRAHG
jgi:5,10-methylenetetrahydromethanopterin reductase